MLIWKNNYTHTVSHSLLASPRVEHMNQNMIFPIYEETFAKYIDIQNM